MQISELKKLLQLISPREREEEERSLEETSEQEAENDLQEEFEAQGKDEEFEAQGDSKGAEEVSATENNRAHLTSSVPRSARVPTGVMTKSELREIRELFGNMDDMEIQRLYKKVTKNN